MVCRQYLIDGAAIAGLATIDAKQAEPGLLAFSLAQNWPLIYFTQTELERYTVHPSVVVKAAVGVSSVCEAAALCAAAQASPDLWSKLMVPKQIFRGTQGLGSVTVAIAMSHPKNLPKASS
jgi:cobalamin biosynthesis protein CbiG